MKERRFARLIALTFYVVSYLVLAGQAMAYNPDDHQFHYDSNISSVRNRVAQYAYEILNYPWTAESEVLGYKGKDDSGNYLTPLKWSSGTTIYGLPYTDSNMKSFVEYKALENSVKSAKLNDYKMQYGMVCASLVTDCIRQELPISLAMDHGVMFHKRSYKNYVKSVESTRIYEDFGSNNGWYNDGVWYNDPTSWYNAFNNIFATLVRQNNYRAYERLSRGDYLLNYNHVVLVIDNYTENGTRKIRYIDQTIVWDDLSNGMVGTHIGDYTYSQLDTKKYIPMYVQYPNDIVSIPDSWIKIDEAHFPDYYFREYLTRYEKNKGREDSRFNGDGYFSDEELNLMTDMGWHGGPHPDNVNPNAYAGWEPQEVLEDNGSLWANIRSIEGIKYFKNLESLYVYNDQIETIDVSEMTKLGDLRCYGNKITNINAYRCTSLWNLEAQNNDLTSITLTDCPNLQKLNLSNNARLKNLYCKDCSLTSLLVSNCSSLSYIDCSGNSNVQLALNGCNSLETLIRDTSVNVKGSAPVFTTTNLPDAKVNTYYSQYVKATGQTASGTPTVFYRISAMKKNLNLSINKTTGLLSGTPTEAVNNANLTIVAYNYIGSTPKSLPVNVLPAVIPPTITTNNITIDAITKQTSFRQGNNIFTGFTATGENITWKISSGKLPSGLSLNSSTGKINGSPDYTEEGKTSWDGVLYKFDITATNAGGLDTKEFKIKVFESPVITTTAGELKDGYVGDKYILEINATGSNIYMGWELASGSFPDGLDFDWNNMSSSSHGSRSAIITGIPTRAATYPFKIKVAAGTLWGIGLSPRSGEYATQDFTIQIADKPVINGSFTNGMVGVEYSSTVEVKGGFSPYSWTYSTPPNGLKVLRNGSKFTLYSTPTKDGNYPFTLTVIDKNGKTATTTFNINIASGGLGINSTNFPDDNFRSHVNKLDKDENGYLSASEIASIKVIDVSNKNIANLKGIEFFTALEELICDGNKLNALDISKNTALKTLHCSKNSLTSLNLSNNKLLENVECDNNKLTALDVSKNVKLDYLSCSGNSIVKLDVSNNTSLKWLYCNGNQLTELILGNNSVLQEVNCENNSSLKTLDITNCEKLSNANVHVDAGIELISSKGIETPIVGDEDELPEFGGSTLVLDGKIGINFYVYLPEGYDPENCYMVFESRRGISNENPVQKYDPNFYSIRRGKKYYAYTCYINSAQMAEEITAIFHFNGNTIIKKDSVDNYLTLVKKNESMFTENVNNLMKAIRNYGHYVQPMLAINGKWTIGDKYAEMQCASEITDEDIEDSKSKVAQYAKVEYKNSTGITKNVGYSLNLDTDTVLNLIFTPSATYSGSVSITVDGNVADVKKVNENGTVKYRVEIGNISAPDLGKTFSVTAEANGINMINISALSYVQAILNANVERVADVPIDVMKQAVTALYRYYTAAKAYFDNGKQ